MNNPEFDLFVFGKKRVKEIQLNVEHSPNSNGDIFPFETQLAIVSHYIQNKGTFYEKQLSKSFNNG